MKVNKSNGVEIEKKKAYLREWNEKNKDKISKKKKEYNKEYLSRLEVKEHRKKYTQEYNQRPEVKKRNLERVKKYSQRPEVKKERQKYQKEYNQRPEVKVRKRKYNSNHREMLKEKQIKYYEENRKKVRNRIRSYVKERYKEDEQYRMNSLLRNRFNSVVNNYSKTGKIKSSKEYGIDYKEIIEHLKPFPKDMGNYEIDHVIPISWFNLRDSKEIKWAFAPENHQWMLKSENRKKSNSFMGGVEI